MTEPTGGDTEVRTTTKTTETNKAAAAKRKAADEFDTPDRQVALAGVPLVPTVEDAAGVERIVGAQLDPGWTPAPVEADPKEIARLESLANKLEEQKQERLDLLKGEESK